MKLIWTSKTFWGNIVALIAAVFGADAIGLDSETQSQIVVGVLAIANIIVRFFTKLPVKIV